MAAIDSRWVELAISIVIPSASGVGGVMLGAWLSGRRENRQRQLAFVEQQLRDFFSPMLGIRSEIRTRRELQVKLQQAADTQWRKLCEEKRQIGLDAIQKMADERREPFTAIIEYDNRQLAKEVIPAYRRMVGLFRDNLWLAEHETKDYFGLLFEFVELWERWLADTIPPEVMRSLEHSEESLLPFYEHLEHKHAELRAKLERGHL